MLADELVKMLKIQSNAAGGSAAIRTAFADVRAKVEDAAERFPEEQDLRRFGFCVRGSGAVLPEQPRLVEAVRHHGATRAEIRAPRAH